VRYTGARYEGGACRRTEARLVKCAKGADGKAARPPARQLQGFIEMARGTRLLSVRGAIGRGFLACGRALRAVAPKAAMLQRPLRRTIGLAGRRWRGTNPAYHADVVLTGVYWAVPASP